jgi:hypothetical protein
MYESYSGRVMNGNHIYGWEMSVCSVRIFCGHSTSSNKLMWNDSECKFLPLPCHGVFFSAEDTNTVKFLGCLRTVQKPNPQTVVDNLEVIYVTTDPYASLIIL